MNPIPPRSDYHSRPLPTTPDRNYAVGSSRTPSRREPPPIPPYSHGATSTGTPQDWQPRIVDDPVRRELEEARARTAQMEKTMRWWSDCTANWREKWSKAREERNQAREECRRLRSELDVSITDCATLAQHRDHLVSQAHSLQQELTQVRDNQFLQSAHTKTAASTMDSLGTVSDSTGNSSMCLQDVNVTETNCTELSVINSKNCCTNCNSGMSQTSVLQKLLEEANSALESKNK